MRAVVLVITASLFGLMACGPSMPDLPRVGRLPESKAEDPGFSIAPRPACSPEARAAFAAPDTGAILRASARGVTFACGNPDDPTFLSHAIFAGDVERVTSLLDAGADPNARWSSRGDRLPIQDAIECELFGYSCARRRLAIVRQLLGAGGDPNARWCPFESRLGIKSRPGCTSDFGSTPLIAATALDAADVVYLLLDAGASPWTTTAEGFRALDHAVSLPTFLLLQAAMFPDGATRQVRTYELLRNIESPPWYRDPQAQTPLARLVSGAVNIGPLPPPPPPDGRLPVRQLRDWLPGVHYLRPQSTGRAGLAELLLDMGADPNERLTDLSDWTPLALALAHDDHFTAEVLLRRGADPNARICGVHPSAWLSDLPHFEPGCARQSGMTPLMLAAGKAAVDTMRLLIRHGADLNARDWRGRTIADFVPREARQAVMMASRNPR